MKWKIAVLSVVLTLGIISVVPAQNRAHAQAVVSVDFFYQELSPYGQWSPHPEFGYIWQPIGVPPDWRPYADGRWEWSDQGWLWISYEPWGWATYHYGRWVYDDYAGWVWIPGTTWAPAWVAWQESPEYIGWSPLPPDRGFFVEIGFVFNSYKSYGHHHHHKNRRYYHDYYDNPHKYRPPRRHTVYMPYKKFGHHKHAGRESIPPEYAIDLRNSKNVTNIRRRNNRVINYGPDKHRVEESSNRKLLNHKIPDRHAVKLRERNNHIKDNSYTPHRSKIERENKNPFITNRGSNIRPDRKNPYSYNRDRLNKNPNKQNPRPHDIQTRRLKQSEASRTYKSNGNKENKPQNNNYGKYGYTNRGGQNKYKRTMPSAQVKNQTPRDNQVQKERLRSAQNNTQKPHKHNNSRHREQEKSQNTNRDKNYSNNQRPSYSEQRPRQQTYNSNRVNIPSSQRNKFTQR